MKMNIKSLTLHRFVGLCFILSLSVVFVSAEGAQQRRYTYEEDNSTLIREMRDSIDSLRHEIENHETELRMFQERVDNQETTVSSLRQQVLDANQANKELVKGSSTASEGRIAALETANKGLIADLQKFKTHANDSTTALAQYKDRIAELEKVIAAQSKNIESLQSAVKSIAEALQAQVKEVPVAADTGASNGKSYRVKAGDTLEKIAKNNGTTLKALKELNNLSNDRIVVGQSLQLP